jgi:diguanylate cyclase (GGDEF)-like protein
MPIQFPFLSRTAERPRLQLSIRVRLILVALLAVVPLALDRVSLMETTRAERIATAYADATDIAKRSADAQVETINAARGMLQAVARAYGALVASGQSCESFASQLVTEASALKSFSVVGADDRIICSSRAGAVGLSTSDLDFIQEARRRGDLAISKDLITRPNHQAAMVAAFPALGPGNKADAIILAPFDLQWIRRLTEALSERHGASVFLVDSKGTILNAAFGDDRSDDHGVADHPFIREVLERKEGTFAAEGPDHVRRMFAVRPLPGTDSHIVVGFDEHDVVNRADREIGIAYLQLILFGLLALLVAWFGGEKLIVEPIRRLARTATRIGHGDLEVHLSPGHWAPEFAPLANALDKMARQLSVRERDLQKTNRHLQELATIDSLSGMANRRSFDTRLEDEWQRACKTEGRIGLLMIDVDHFKLYNDHYGHLEGDACLRRVGELLSSGVDQTDFAARYGGEEFVVLLPDAGADHARAIAERVRTRVAQQAIANKPAPNGLVTVSIGIATMQPQSGESPQSLIEAADAMLYEAKRRGRNTAAGPIGHEVFETS